jgi:hypothetical protein
LNDQPVIAVQFDPRQPQHFIAAFADSTIMQFNLFGEDPLPIVQSTTLPWSTYFEETDSRVELDVEKRPAATTAGTGAGSGAGAGANGTSGNNQSATSGPSTNGTSHTQDGEDVFEDVMITWRNPDWAVQLTEKEKKMENRNPWAGKNPCAVTKIGKKGITGESIKP